MQNAQLAAFSARAAAASGYGAQKTATATPMDMQKTVFARSIHALKAAAALRKTNPAKFHKTLADNKILWNTLAAEAASAESGLPDEVRASILSLSHFVRDQSARVAEGSARIDSLIEVNLAIWRGLDGQVPQRRGT